MSSTIEELQKSHLLILLQAAENIMYAFNLPTEISSKYESLRTKTLKKCSIPYIPISYPEKTLRTPLKLQSLSASSQTDSETFLYLFQSSLFDFFSEATVKLSRITSALSSTSEPMKGVNEFLNELKRYPSSNLKSVESIKELSHQKFSLMLCIFDLLIEYSETMNLHMIGIVEELKQQEIIIQSKQSDFRIAFEEREAKWRKELEINCAEDIEERKQLQDMINFLENTNKAHAQEVQSILHERNAYKELSERYKEENELIKCDFEEIVKSLKEENEENRKAHSRDVENIKSEMEFVKLKLNEEIEQVNEASIENISEVTKKHLQNVQEIEKHFAKELKAERNKWEVRENQFFKHIEQTKMEIFSKNSELAIKNARIDEMINELQRIYEERDGIFLLLFKLVTKYSNSKPSPCEDEKKFEEMRKNLYVLESIIDKAAIENDWLVSQVKEIKSKNETLKSSIRKSTSSGLRQDLEHNSTVVQDFERSRMNLHSHFAASTPQFTQTHLKLSEKHPNHF